MELIAYLRLARRWWWLLILGTFLAGGAAYLNTGRQDDLYRSQTVISVGTSISAPNPAVSEIYTGQALAQNYVVLAKTDVVLQGAIDAYDLPLSTGELRQGLSIQVVPDTTFIEIVATHSDPILVVEIGEAVAEQLIANSPSNLTAEQQTQLNLANAEIDRLNGQLDTLRERLNEIELELQNETDPVRVTQLNEQYNTLVNQINGASSNIASFSDTVTRIQERTNALTVVEPARELGPVPQSTMRNSILGAIVGFSLAAGAALLMEYLDDTIRSSEAVRAVLELPTLAMIPSFGKKKDEYPDRLVAYLQPSSRASEEYRTLRTNLMFSMNGQRRGVFVVTSPGPGDGKTVTTANLGVAVASAGWRVLLIDADLRRPRLHDIFGTDNHFGLSTLLAMLPNESLPESRSILDLPPNLQGCIQETEIPNLLLMPSGDLPLNPAEVLGSTSMQFLYQWLMSSPDVDIVLFDTPPVLVAADVVALASTLELPAMLVIEAGKSRPQPTIRAKERLTSLDIEVKGVVLNAVTRRDISSDYAYDYYYYYKSHSDTQGTPNEQRNGSRRRERESG
jgi:polysaccharide biosynthesis transport protein